MTDTGEMIEIGATAAKQLREALLAAEIYVAACSATSVIPFCHLTKAFQTHEAVLTLCRAGFGSEAFALSRLILEMSMTLRWITNKEQVKRCEAFALFEAKRKQYFAETYTRYNPSSAAFAGAIQHIENLYRQYTEKYDSFKFWSNSPNNLRAMTEENDILYTMPATPNDLWHYDIPYSMASDHVHCNSMSMIECYPPLGAPYDVKVAANDKLIDQAAFSATQWLFLVMARVDTYRELELTDKINAAYAPFRDFVLAHP